MLALLTRNAPLTTEERNFHHLVMDIAWFGVSLVATTRFLVVFALRLEATPAQIGLITALPSLIVFLATPLGLWWLRRHRNSVRAMILPSLVHRCGLLLLIFAPLLPPAWQPAWLIAAVVLPAVPQAISGAIFFRILRDTIQQGRMTSLISRRSVAQNAAIAVGALGFGFALEEIAFPYNYQFMFLISFVAMMISLWHVSRLEPIAGIPDAVKATSTLPSPWRTRSFWSVIIVVMLSFAAFYAVFPLVPIYLVERLGVGEGYMAVFSLIELGAGATIGFVTNRIVQQVGTRRTTALGVIGTAAGTLAIVLAPIPALALVGAALIGAAWTVVGVGSYGFFIEHTRPEDVNATNAYAQVMALAMFVGPLLGSLVVEIGIDIGTTLLLGAGLRLLAGLLISVEPGTRRQTTEQRFHI
jgi:MFS family permease